MAACPEVRLSYPHLYPYGISCVLMTISVEQNSIVFNAFRRDVVSHHEDFLWECKSPFSTFSYIGDT